VSKPNLGGYVTGLCDGISKELGQEFDVGRVLVQQQLQESLKMSPLKVLYGR
jgi:hypothetical protein